MSAGPIHRIQTIALFTGCRRPELELIDQQGMTVTVRAGRTLYREGKPGSQFFVLLDGLVQVQNARGDLALLHPGAWFGETALIRKTAREATVTTVVDSTVIVFNRREFNTIRDAAPQVRERLQTTAELITRGDAPTSQAWYQAIDGHSPTRAAPATRSQTDGHVAPLT